MGDFRRLLQAQLDEFRDAVVAQHVQELAAVQKELRDLKQQFDNSVVSVPSEASLTPSASFRDGSPESHESNSEPFEGSERSTVGNPHNASQRADLPRLNSMRRRYTVREFWVSKYQLLQYCSGSKTQKLNRGESSKLKVGTQSTCFLKGLRRKRSQFVLDPDLLISKLWRCCSILLLVYDLLYIPLDLSFDVPKTTWSKTMTWIAILFWTADIALSFFTGVYIAGQKEMRIQRIACRYARSWLSMDVVIVGADWTMVLISGGSSQRSLALLRMFRFFRLVRLLRLKKFVKMFLDLSEGLSSAMPNSLSAISDFILTFVKLAITLHILSCAWYGLAKSSDATWVLTAAAADDVFYNYLMSMQRSLSMLHDSNQAHLDSVAERALACATAFVTVVLYSLVVARTTYAVFAAKDSRAAKILASSWQFRKAKKISSSLAIRVRHYLQAQREAGLGDELTNELMFLAALPETLQIDLHAEVRTPVLSNVQLFKDMQDYNARVLRKICHAAITEMLVLEKDAVFALGDARTEMFFVTRGCFSYSQGERGANATASELDVQGSEPEVAVVEVGMHLCEPALWTSWENKGDFTATRDSLLLALSADKLEESIRHHHSASVHALKYARHFVWCLNHGEEPVDSDIVDVRLPIAYLDSELFTGSEENHFIFISHFKKESGTEATLMSVDLEHMIREDHNNAASEFRYPVFLDSENLRDLASLTSHVKKSRHLLLLLTPGVLSRPWCLVELVHAVRQRVEVTPVEVHRPGTEFEYPTQKYYERLLAGEMLSAEAVRLLREEGIRLRELVFCLRKVFQKIALSFSPHKSSNIRQAELKEILQACKPIHWGERIQVATSERRQQASTSMHL